jgi:hypothetical protein
MRLASRVRGTRPLPFSEPPPMPTKRNYNIKAGSSHPLNAWCELPVRNLSGRSPHSRVGLTPNPEGKGTYPSCSMWTPSSLHSTLRSTTSASPTLQKGSQDHTHLSVRARSSPSPSSPAGRGSPARGTSTATPRPTSQMPSPPFASVPSSIGWCALVYELAADYLAQDRAR